MPKIKLLYPMTFEASILEAGEVIDVDEHSAKAHVENQRAEYAIVQGDDGNASSDDQNGGDSGDNDENKGNTPEDPDGEREKLKKAIYDKYNADELKEAAKDLGVEFGHDFNKGQVIDAAIEADKGEALLNK